MNNPYGWLSLLPPLIAITLAVLTRRVLLALLVGIAGAAVLIVRETAEGSPLLAFFHLFSEDLLWKNLIDGDHLRVITFTLLMGCMVSVIHQSGGMAALVATLKPIARGRRSTQTLTWLLGLVVFFDDYANTLLLGHTMRSVSDRWKVSREKLAYLVDSTAAPVAGLALVSTWIAGEIGYINDGLEAASISDFDGFSIFVRTIPYRFYVLLALVMVALIAVTGRDAGPMLAAERRAAQGEDEQSTEEACDTHGASWIDAVLPILTVVVVTFGLLYATGAGSPEAQQLTTLGILSQGDSYLALVYAALAGLVVSVVLGLSRRLLTPEKMKEAIGQGALLVAPSLAILWLSWTLSAATREDYLDTGSYLAATLQDTIALPWFPTVTFVLAGAVAFATGTSWGTMGLLMPTVVSTTVSIMRQQELAIADDSPVLLASIGGVLAGAIFGDHCSPISDTTVLSSQASGCDHIAHVRTQLPYALFVGIVSIACGTLPVGFGAPVMVCLPIGLLALFAATFLIGRSP